MEFIVVNHSSCKFTARFEMGGAGGGIFLLIVANVAFMPPLEAIKDVTINIGGIIVPVFATVDIYGKIKTDNIRQYAQFLKDRGANGVVVGSTTGEGPSLTVDDKKMLLDAWVDACDPLGLDVIAEVGAAPLTYAEELAAYAQSIRVSAIFILPELYFRARNARELVFNVQFIARAASETAIVFDDNPQYTGVYVDMVEFLELATEKIPNFKGIKTDIFSNALKIQNRLVDDQKLFVAREIYLEPAVLIGINNFVMSMSNITPQTIRDIIKYAKRGNVKKSTSLYRKLLRLEDIIIEEGNAIAALKAAMPIITGIEVGEVLPPNPPLSDEQKSNLQVRLRENNIKIFD